MTEETRFFETDIAVIGSGLAGCSASIFALNLGLTATQAGNTGAIAYTTGYFDLLGYLSGDNQLLEDPWQGLAQLRKEEPGHPLAKLSDEEINDAFKQVTAFISEAGIAYVTPDSLNHTALTPAGTTKPTYSIPGTMLGGVTGFAEKVSCVIIDFKGLRGFSSREVVANIQQHWPGIRAERVTFPEMESGEIYPEVMARALEVPRVQELLAAEIKGVMGDADLIGMPAIMGMHNPDEVMNKLQTLIGKPLFEIPTMPPSVPGIRLREMFEQVFPAKGISLIPQQKIRSVDFTDDYVELSLTDSYGPINIKAKTAILATGRFLSGGLEATIDGIRETLLNIPVSQPEDRSQWYHEKYMGAEGHRVHYAGIEVDDMFRPLAADGRPIDERLFAAGIVLANQDWIRSRCGAGVAIATAYRAVQSAKTVIEQRG